MPKSNFVHIANVTGSLVLFQEFNKFAAIMSITY
jgi:hypothetical protein